LTATVWLVQNPKAKFNQDISWVIEGAKQAADANAKANAVKTPTSP